MRLFLRPVAKGLRALSADADSPQRLGAVILDFG